MACHAGHQALGLRPILRLLSSAPCRRRPLSSNVRQHKFMPCQVVAVHRKAEHAFSKTSVVFIDLVLGHGVLHDAHFGVTVKHRSRVAKDPTQPNLRQVHLLHVELLEEVAKLGLHIRKGQMGENLTTRGIDLLGMSTGTRLQLGPDAIVEITGLRNPCAQIEAFKPGLLAAVLDRSNGGQLIRKAGVMAIVVRNGRVQPSDDIAVVFEPNEYKMLLPV